MAKSKPRIILQATIDLSAIKSIHDYQLVSKSEIDMAEHANDRYIDFEYLPLALKRTLQHARSVNPFGDEEVRGALLVKEVERLNLYLLHTPTPKLELLPAEFGSESQGQLKMERLKQANSVAKELVASAEAGQLDGETYLRKLSLSPDPQATRNSIRLMKRRGVAITATKFAICDDQPVNVPNEFVCSNGYPVELEVVECQGAGPGTFKFRVRRALSHPDFWQYFQQGPYELTVSDALAFKKIRLAYAADCPLICTISVTVVPNLDRGKDGLTAALVSIDDDLSNMDSRVRELRTQLDLKY